MCGILLLFILVGKIIFIIFIISNLWIFVFSGRLELTYGSHKDGKFDFFERVDFDYDQKLYDGITYILASGRVKTGKKWLSQQEFQHFFWSN